MTISQGALKQKFSHARCPSYHPINSVKKHQTNKKDKKSSVAEIANCTAYDIHYIATDYSTDNTVIWGLVEFSFNNNNTS